MIMREIKFRIYSEESKQFISVEHSLIMLDELNDLKPHLKVMQYTGLKDKNGVEIYCGDIVNSNYFKNATVVFWRYGWYFNAGKDNHYSFNTASHSFEVIGNIHENPELLN